MYVHAASRESVRYAAVPPVGSFTVHNRLEASVNITSVLLSPCMGTFVGWKATPNVVPMDGIFFVVT